MYKQGRPPQIIYDLGHSLHLEHAGEKFKKEVAA